MQVAKKSGIQMVHGIAINSGAAASMKLGMSPYSLVRELAASNAVVVFSMSGCCMCTVAKQLLRGLGVGPLVIELDQHANGPEIEAVLYEVCQEDQQPIPAVFVGGKFLGGVESLMACHINGSLVPLLKDAGALWL
ncbi:glutaredoxin-C9-like isoform X2 [Juglans microcarpa x Juglans regia]|nr:glutaredoxin-C9-like isoform X2 [Juglans microcarpa x Juglans regia]